MGSGDFDMNGSVLRHMTKGNASPQGRPRVYFCCHKDDFYKYFNQIAEDILDAQWNAAIWCRDPERPLPQGEDFLDDLAQMQLFVVPVTTNFLFNDDPARDVEFAFAEEHHIPVLPLMQEPGLEESFNNICGDLQFLDKNASRRDATALPYKDKLKKFLGSVLVDDKMAERIRAAFDAYIFLSYRKKDRAAAQKVMKKIHQIKGCRDMAIWYDEFLTPGENFNSEIEGAMAKSRLFTMVVTPSLLEDPNYVQTTEYPAARDMDMKILPVEAEDTDEEELKRMYEGIGECFPLSDPVAVALKLKDLMSDVIFGAKQDDPEHQFLMGLAYLSGVDVEVDQKRAVHLISEAADEGKLPEAYEKMINMLRTGDAVERDYDEAIAWQDEYVDLLEEKAEEEQTAEAYQDYFIALTYLQQYQVDQEDEDAYDNAVRMKDAAEKLRQLGHENALWDLSVAYERLGDSCFDREEMDEAEDWYNKALNAREIIVEEKDSPEAWSDLGFTYSRMGDACAAAGKFDDALEWYEKELNIRQWYGEDEGRKHLADTYSKIGDLYGQYGKYREARDWYDKDLDLSRMIYEETGTPEAAQDLAVAYGRQGLISTREGHLGEARFWYEKDLELSKTAYYETETLNSLWNLYVVYENLGDISEAEGKFKEAKDWYFNAEDACAEYAEMTQTVEAVRNHAEITLKTADLLDQMGNSLGAQMWYEDDRKLWMTIVSAEAEDEEEGVSVRTLEGLAASIFKLGTLSVVKTEERKAYLEEFVQIGTALYNVTRSEKHLNFILLGQRELAKL